MSSDLKKAYVSLDKDALDGICESDPTLEQIEIETAKIREGWTDKQRESRRVTKYSQFVATPVCIDEWAASIASTLRSFS